MQDTQLPISTTPNQPHVQQGGIRAQKSIQNRLQFLLFLCKLPKCTPFDMHDNSKIVFSERHWKPQHQVVALTTYSLMLLGMFFECLFFGFKTGSIDNPDTPGKLDPSILLRFPVIIVQLGGGLYFYVLKKHAQEMVILVNDMTQRLERNRVPHIKILEGVISMMSLASLAMTSVLVAVQILCPEVPPFPTSMIFKTKLKEYYWLAFASRFFLSLVNAWNLAVYATNGYFIMSTVFLCIGGLHLSTKALMSSNSHAGFLRNDGLYNVGGHGDTKC
ncbi:unnamed protein product [Orchesella dallaii]|uniref:Uncharacterized protein n=1 Tax=Orchesella dallaii TaxID=48710 RepID=A0ABP1S7U8_9HEXA